MTSKTDLPKRDKGNPLSENTVHDFNKNRHHAGRAFTKERHNFVMTPNYPLRDSKALVQL